MPQGKGTYGSKVGRPKKTKGKVKSKKKLFFNFKGRSKVSDSFNSLIVANT